MKVILASAFIFLCMISSAQPPEQCAFNDFSSNYLDQYEKLNFKGFTKKTYSGAFIDYSTCFSEDEETLNSIAENLNSLNNHQIKIEFSKTIFSGSRKHGKLNIYKATPINDKFIVRIDVVRENHINQYYYLLDSSSRIEDKCTRSILVD